jgi:hypothetical protein
MIMKISTILEADNELLLKLKSALLRGVPAGGHKVSLSDVQIDKDSLSVHYWGKWEMPEGEEDDGDYDWEVLSKSSQAQLKSVVTKFEKENKCKVDYQTSEKNWIEFSIR